MSTSKFDQKDVSISKKVVSYRGFFKMLTYTLKHRLFSGGWSQEFTRELFVRGEAVAAILYDPQKDAIGYVEQFRVGAIATSKTPWCYEVIAGIVEQGETPESCIERELIEEANFTAEQLIPIGSYLSSPGGCDERIHLFCALGTLDEGGGIFGLEHENEDIRLHVESADQVFERIFTDRFDNAATVIALQWLQQHRDQLKAR